MKNMLISLIIPVYNVEAYLRQCLESVIQQTYHDLEIILVDDGSLDNSGTICDDYGEHDNRVIVVHQANGGVSAARNTGLDICSGAYVGFVDGDDYLEPDMVETLVGFSGQADLIVSYLNDVDETGRIGRASAYAGLNKRYGDADEFLADVFTDRIVNGVTGKLFKRTLFEYVRFDETFRMAEDILLWLPLCRQVCQDIVVVSVKKYNRIIRAGSLCSFTEFSEAIFFDVKAREAIRKELALRGYPLNTIGIICYCKGQLLLLRQLFAYGQEQSYADEALAAQQAIRSHMRILLADEHMGMRAKVAFILASLNPALLHWCDAIFGKIKVRLHS